MTNALARISFIALGVATLGACSEPAPSAIDDQPFMQANRSADRCINVEYAGVTPLGPWLLNGQIVPGAPPIAVTLAGVNGWLASVLDVAGMRIPGQSGTAHWSLRHYFLSDAPVLVDLGGGFAVQAVDLASQTSYFFTDDRAVCAAAGSNPLSCRVNDQMTIRDGIGVFANASGFIHNHGMITLIDPVFGIGSGDFRLRGRVCGDGL